MNERRGCDSPGCERQRDDHVILLGPEETEGVIRQSHEPNGERATGCEKLKQQQVTGARRRSRDRTDSKTEKRF